MTTHIIDGPLFEDFSVGQLFGAPSVTVTEGYTAIYQATTGDRMRLPLDTHLSSQVTKDTRAIVHPMLVINVVNGQTTYASQNVKGNLFYRGLILKRPVFVNDTLTTVTKVIGLKQNKAKAGRDATGMVGLEIETKNQKNEVVMKYWRCPMIPCRQKDVATGKNDDFSWIPEKLSIEELTACTRLSWDTAPLVNSAFSPTIPSFSVGDHVIISGQDTITAAPELVRLTGNIAFAHTDASRSYLNKRLVYGGHTISLAYAQIMRAMPNTIALVGWQGCDHLGPVLEEDIIRSEFTVTSIDPLQSGGSLYELNVYTYAKRLNQEGEYVESKVLDWRLVIWV